VEPRSVAKRKGAAQALRVPLSKHAAMRDNVHIWRSVAAAFAD